MLLLWVCGWWAGLAHSVNEGYRDFVGCQLHRLNGVRVRNMAHLVEGLQPLLDPSVAPERSHVVVSFVGYEEMAVFETRALRSATPTICKQHKVPAWTSLLEPPSIG